MFISVNLWLNFFLFTQFLGVPRFDPKLSWYTLETKNFSVHFPGPLAVNQKLAKDVAWLAENAHSHLTHLVGWQPRGKTNLVIADFYDYSFGFANPFPDNTIFITPNFPTEDYIGYQDWLRTLLTHEYTHILQLDMVSGLPGFLRNFFGRFIIPNGIIPVWLLEGLSVYNEGKTVESSYYEMFFRTQVLEQRLFPIDKVATYDLRQFPGFNAPYFYGGAFLGYLSRRFGKDKLVKYFHSHSGSLPFFINYHSRKVFGYSFTTLWKDWQKEMRNKYQIAENPPSIGRLRNAESGIDEGYYINSPIFSFYGEKIYYISYHPDHYPSLKSFDFTTLEKRILLKGVLGSVLSLAPDGQKLLFSLKKIYQNYFDYDDLYLFDLATKKLQRLTNGMRAKDPDFSPQKEFIVFVNNERGQTNLRLLDTFGRITNLTENDDYRQYSRPKFSPDGKKIAVSILERSGYYDIMLFDLETGWQVPITQDRAVDKDPYWSSDGKYILFASDRSGVFNIYAYSLQNKRLYQVTDVLTGAFSPAVSRDGKRIAFTLYTSKGYEVRIIDYNPNSWGEITALPIKEEERWGPDDTTEIFGQLFYYTPFPSLYPKAWLPLVSYDKNFNFGFFTIGSDVLRHHNFFLSLNYSLEQKSPFGFFNYFSQRTPFLLYLYGAKDVQFGELGLYFPFYRTTAFHSIYPYYRFKQMASYRLSGLGFDWYFNNTKRYGYSISPTDGNLITVSLNHNEKLIKSDYNLTRIIANINRYVSMPLRHNVLVLKLISGMAFGDSQIVRSFYYNLRGFLSDTTGSDKILATGIEYRFPLVWVERGYSTLPLFFSNLSGRIFSNALFETTPLFSSFNKGILVNIGAEFRAEITFAYLLPVILRLGWAKGVTKDGQNEIYFRLESSLIESLLYPRAERFEKPY